MEVKELNKVGLRLLECYWYDIVNEAMVSKRLKEKDYELLSDDLAIGPVYKMPYEGDYEKNGYERSFIYLPAGSGIKEHIHLNDVEQYTLVNGILRINKREVCKNRCMLEESHSIDPVMVDTTIKSLKISKKLIMKKMK